MNPGTLVQEIAELGPVAAAHRFDTDRLARYLKGRLPGLTGRIEVAQMQGGRSNPTFLLREDGLEWVLRKQPPGTLLPSAHAVDREYRVLTALGHTDVPVPQTFLFCDDRSVIGTPFYVMQRMRGRVSHDSAIPGVPAAERAAMYQAVIEILARIHKVDWKALGLADYGKPGNYFARQLSRWTKQWYASKTREIPEVERLIAWLPDHIPSSDDTTLCHGDYRIGNVMFHPTEPRIIAVFDWELSTLGHPLADLAYFCMLYHQTAEEFGGVLDLDPGRLGIPTQDELVQRYCALTGRGEGLEPFHIIFSMFRLVAILEGVRARTLAGNVSSLDGREVTERSVILARRAVELIDSSSA
jgi:aminoglycoside phosphotransferase (APT) family kinase protein